jgi:hypothetical protein
MLNNLMCEASSDGVVEAELTYKDVNRFED